MKYSRHIEGETHDEERALYNLTDALVSNCTFAGPADGESALKECKNIKVENCRFFLRYPLWHAQNLRAENCRATSTARAAAWYCKGASFENCTLEGIKVFRECDDTEISGCKIDSPETGWLCRKFVARKCDITSEYFLFGSSDITLKEVNFKGKYSLQYIKNADISDCNLETKDSLWHSKNVTVKNSLLKSEYLGWYSENLTLINCVIDGIQPLCYCKNLRLIDCVMKNCTLAFELSDVHAKIVGSIGSVRTPLSGEISADEILEIVNDIGIERTAARIIIGGKDI